MPQDTFHPVDPLRFALTGAAGGFARTLLPHARTQPDLRATVLVDVDATALRAVAERSGYPAAQLLECSTVPDVRSAVEAGLTALVTDVDLLDASVFDVVVEATGRPATGHRVALRAVEEGRSVVLVSKETEATTGAYLRRRAAATGARVLSAGGDQPAGIADLVDWARSCGLTVLAAGKAGEHDLVLHGDGTASHQEATGDGAALRELWDLPPADLSTGLAARAEASRGFALRSAADVCELVVAAGATGLRPDVPDLHHPVVRTGELADVFAPRSAGGLLDGVGAIDVFTQLRRDDEASLAGGVFVVVAVPDVDTADVLAAKGHVVSRDRRRVCVLRPYHLMGLETVATVRGALAPAHASPPGAVPPPPVRMVAVARRALPAGTRFTVHGHHHEIDGLAPSTSTDPAGDAAPFHGLDGTLLRRDLAAGETVLIGDVEGFDEEFLAAALASTPDGVPA